MIPDRRIGGIRKKIYTLMLVVAILLILVSSMVILSAFIAPILRPAGTSSSEMGAEGELVKINVPWKEGVRGFPMPPFRRFPLDAGVKEIARRYGRAPLLPKWLPEGMKYQEVYIGPVAVICYSDRKVENFLFANVTIEVSKYSRAPTLDQLKSEAEKSGGRLIVINGVGVVIFEKAEPPPIEGFRPSPLAYFFKDGLYYIVGVKSPLTPQDLINVIESMEPASV